MDVKSIRAARRFSADKMVKSNLFETGRLYYDVYCLEPGQSQKVHSHATSDKVYLLLDGAAVITVGDEERTLAPEEAVLCPAGVVHGVRNDGAERAALLVVTAPPLK
jgi:mannose-6-phosphate isomerase-like protein (cupin superfamily)